VRITTWAEYGLICALHLARRDEEGPVTGREIAARERLPGDYVEQILLRLRRAEIVRSQRGARGGYLLARAAADISVREVIQASELETFDLHCATNPVEELRCSAAESCSIRPVWMVLQQRIDDVLEGVKLADLLDDEWWCGRASASGPRPPRSSRRHVRGRAGRRARPASPRPPRGPPAGCPSSTAERAARAAVRRAFARGAAGGVGVRARGLRRAARRRRALARRPRHRRRRGPRPLGAALRAPRCGPPPRPARRARRPHRLPRRPRR
jgi:Rrf2 family protein